MALSADVLQRAVGCTSSVARLWLPYLLPAIELAQLSTRYRLSAFLATVGHESAGLTQLVERLSYSPERLHELCAAAPVGSRWHSLLPRVPSLARNPQALANAAYAGRMGNGDEASGDGWRFRGRGLIQNTGRANYAAVRDELRERGLANVPDLVALPDALAEPKWAAFAAAAFWLEHDLNTLADEGEFRRLTRRVNGGEHGMDDRLTRLGRAMGALK